MTLPAPLYALVLTEELKATKNDKHFWASTLKTVVGNVKALMWNAHPKAKTDPKFPHQGDLVEITGYEDNMAERGNIVIKGFNRITKDDLPKNAKSIIEFPKASPEELKEALDIIGDSTFWDNPVHYLFATACFKKFDKKKLLSCPAATHVHHSYEGGLIVHTAEVLSLCRAVVEASSRYRFINRDVLYASAILHDLGKVETYYIDDLGIAGTEQTEKIIGHLFYSMHVIKNVAAENHTISNDFVNEVLHCVASHHGEPQYGSIKEIQSIEAGILSRADYISSRNGMLETALKDSIKSGQPLQPEFKIYGSNYFTTSGMKNYIVKD